MIYVFKTSVSEKSEIDSITEKLNTILPLAKWNFDLEDCDNILRIDSETDIRKNILQNGIFDCFELH